METTDADEPQLGAPVPPTGLSPALRARAEAGWRKFLDRWADTCAVPGEGSYVTPSEESAPSTEA
ncbi:hypothetical protein ACFW6S_18160 [Streptomyces sp. NPDC058740]|uniref:hypothetical protein n=1 Tax=Streptomyces sp. NPDC058740 TaxID=3346619 RepID=UPI0036C38CDF